MSGVGPDYLPIDAFIKDTSDTPRRIDDPARRCVA
jgi:hypothetical protein